MKKNILLLLQLLVFSQVMHTEVNVNHYMYSTVAAPGISYSLVHKGKQGFAEQFVLIGFLLGIGACASHYASHREPNFSKVRRVDNIWNKVASDLFACTTLEELQKVLVKFDFLIHDITILNKSLQDRYGSWFKPWNWTCEMKQAYEKTFLLGFVFEHSDIIMKAQGGLTEQALLEHARERYSLTCSYPVLVYTEWLRSNINNFDSIAWHFSPQLRQVMYNILTNALSVVLRSGIYLEEKRLQEEKLLQKRAVEAQESRNSIMQASFYESLKK